MVVSQTRATVPAMPAPVAEVFANYPEPAQARLLALRALIFETAASINGVGPLTETLKWGEPAYLTAKTKAGSTIRLGCKAKAPTQYALYVNCNTNLVDSFRSFFPELDYQGDRAILLETSAAPPRDALAYCVELALTYHLRKRRKGRA